MFLPSVLVETYLDYAQQHGVHLDDSSIGFHPFENVSRIDLIQYLKLIDTIRTQLPEHDIGADIGWRFSPQLFDPLGTAIVSAPNVQSALDTAHRFWDLFGLGLALSVHEHSDNIELEIQSVFCIDQALQRIILKSAVICLYKILVQLLPYHQADFILSFKDSLQTADFLNRRIQIQMNTERWQISFPKDLMHEVNFCANALRFDQAIAECESSLKLSQAADLHYSLHETLSTLASQQMVSTKTIYRRMQQKGQNFQQLKQRKKYAAALNLLNNPEISIEQIAEQLGYTNPSNFSRAFNRWANMSPSQFREKSFKPEES